MTKPESSLFAESVAVRDSGARTKTKNPFFSTFCFWLGLHHGGQNNGTASGPINTEIGMSNVKYHSCNLSLAFLERFSMLTVMTAQSGS